MKRALLVGGTSSLALALYPRLASSHQVVTAGRTNCEIPLDLSIPTQAVSLPDDIDVVIHTASHFAGPSDTDGCMAHIVNALGTLRLCQAATRARVKHFIFISSIFSKLPEDSPFFSPYALSKRHAEDLASYHGATHLLPLTILRPSQLYGDGARLRIHQPFFQSILDQAARGDETILFGSHDPQRNYLHLDDLVEVILRVIQHQIVGTYDCLHPEDVSYGRIAKAAYAALEQPARIRFLKEKADIADNVFEKDDTLYAKIGFRPQISIEEGVRRLLEKGRVTL